VSQITFQSVLTSKCLVAAAVAVAVVVVVPAAVVAGTAAVAVAENLPTRATSET